MADEPQTDTLSEFLLDLVAALGWGKAYPIFVVGFFVISNHFKSLFIGIAVVRPPLRPPFARPEAHEGERLLHLILGDAKGKFRTGKLPVQGLSIHRIMHY